MSLLVIRKKQVLTPHFSEALLIHHLLAGTLGIATHLLHHLGLHHTGLGVLQLTGLAREGDQLGGAGGWLVSIACRSAKD